MTPSQPAPADDRSTPDPWTELRRSTHVREALGLRPAPEFESWLVRLGMTDGAGRILPVDPGESPLLSLTAGR